MAQKIRNGSCNIRIIRKMAFILVLWLGEQVQDVIQGQEPS